MPVAFAPFPEDERPRPPADAVAWRLRASEWQDDAPDHFAESLDWFFEHVETEKVRAIVVGEWEECYESDSAPIIARLVAERDRLPALRSLFLGAIAQEEAEISWIQQSDITPLLEAFPKLERLEVRGGTGLALQPVRHESLRVLRFETGGLPGHVVRAVGDCDLPALEHLELWLGVEEYGGDATIPDCAAVLSGARLPSLRHLGLQDSEMQDDIAAAVASAPVVARLEWLDLSMGVLTDVGAEALLSGQPLTHLRTLDLSHHYLSDEMMRRLPESLPGVRVILDDLQKPDGEWRYVAVSE
ncbi:cytoplasmic protein [Nonomuraea aridisoli]|uniref:Cytoplasmic protein n=1 Tax=Nonomuraea aridisoli TaxID=2070368 RepID=A0A2W2E9F6_9ACTN|nr:cytoplasmic protein [Nonomuraea aridisoli]